MEGFIYKVTNKENGKIYIGQTTRTIEERWNEHTRNAFHDNNLEYQNKFHRAIRKYGDGGFIVEEQESFDAPDIEALHKLLNDAETKWILFYDSKDNGYNSSLGGDYNPMYGVRGKDNPCSKKVNQYDLQGHYIKTWDSIKDIKRELGWEGNISKVCSKNRLNYRKVTAYKHVWRFYEDEPICNDIVISEEELEIRNGRKKFLEENMRPKKKIDQFTLDGKFIKTFNSIREAADSVKGDPSGVTVVAQGKQYKHTYKGYVWKYHIE